MEHIRPKVRKAQAKEAIPSSGSSDTKTDDKSLEESRTKLEQWMGIGERPVGVSASEGLSGIPRTVSIQPETPKSILRKPKYSSNPPSQIDPSEGDSTDHSIPGKKQQSVFKQNQIFERDIKNPSTRNAEEGGAILRGSAAAVEGYEPKFDHNKRLNSSKKDDKAKSDGSDIEEDGEPLIFNALADMMEKIGTLPPQDSSEPAQVVEADVSFSCLSPEEYQRQLLLQEMSQLEETKNEGGLKEKTAEWKKESRPLSVADDKIEGGYTGNNPVSDEETEDLDDDESSGGGNGFFDLVGGDASDEEESEAGNSRQFQPRAFRVIWECLSPLITHESVEFLRKLRREHESGDFSGYSMTATPTDDLIASRSNGFMAMLRMYMSRSLEDLGMSTDMRRAAEQRLMGLIYTFNFSRPAGKLETPQWRALTCILLEIVFFLDTDYKGENGPASTKLPECVKATGITVDEYQYLARNTIRTFDIPDPVLEIPN